MVGFLLVTDLDHTYVGDRPALQKLQTLMQFLRNQGVKLVYSTGRSHTSYQELAAEEQLITPDILVTAVGTEIRNQDCLDQAWSEHLNWQWSTTTVQTLVQQYPQLIPQPAAEQNPYKVSFFLKPEYQDVLKPLEAELAAQNIQANLVYSSDRDLDILPIRANKGHALTYVREQLGFVPDRTVACGDSGNDIALFLENTLGIIVGNARPELLDWHRGMGSDRQYLAQKNYAAGILEGLAHFGFLSS
jgi:sucrose-6-phosphatase